MVRDNRADNNLGGIEIENTRNARVLNNNSSDNSIGMSFIVLPELSIKDTTGVVAQRNTLTDNNRPYRSAPSIARARLPNRLATRMRDAMNSHRAGVLATIYAALAACSPAPSAPPPPPKPPETVDGAYRGTSTRFQADSRACPHPGLVRIEVIGNAFQYRWDRNTMVDATIAPDGAITGGAERITLVGKQIGPKIEGDVTNGNCGLHFTLTKQP